MVDCLLLLDGAEIPREICDPSTSVVHVSPIVMKKVSGMQSIDSVEAIALMKIPARFLELNGDQEEMIYQNWFPSPKRILVLDAIQVVPIQFDVCLNGLCLCHYTISHLEVA